MIFHIYILSFQFLLLIFTLLTPLSHQKDTFLMCIHKDTDLNTLVIQRPQEDTTC